MAMSSSRWQEITPSQFQWEREALEYIRKRLPDHDPYRAWTNFEFIANDGSINEVDALIVTPAGCFIVEVKSRPGHITGDAGTWTWKSEAGRMFTDDNPILLANRKAEKLASMLRGQKAFAKIRCPFIEALVFCSAEDLTWDLKGNGKYRICFRDMKKKTGTAVPVIEEALRQRNAPGMKQNVQVIDKQVSAAFGRSLEQIGIRPSQKSRKVGDYLIGDLIFQCPKDTYQDFEATHVTVKNVKRRVRIYNVSRNESQAIKQMIQKAAEREFKLLNTLSHESILPAETLSQHDTGPAVIYPFEPDAMRLDHYLRQYHDTVGVDIRLSLIRQIAEAVKYAHGKDVIHRALSPYSVLVLNTESSKPSIKILNWQAGRQTKQYSTTTESLNPLVTIHPQELMGDASLLYMAPEGLRAADIHEPYIDVFSLGAIAYLIFTGEPPASSVMNLTEKLNQYKGLNIATAIDGAGKELCELIGYSTHPDVLNRYDSVDYFLDQLQCVEDELTQPDEEFIDNPLEATTGDQIEGGFYVLERLGKGGSATVFQVKHNKEEVVLKVANKPDINGRLKTEYQTLQKIRHPLIVQTYEEYDISGLYAFTMQRAGNKTLAQRLREEGQLQLEFLKRFGEDLLQISVHLEDTGIYHRDVKPENIGIGSAGHKGKLRLFLFDFSLAASSLDNIQVGTLKYHDPFLSSRKPTRWDFYAERFCVAMTLYEMATGTLPIWGDGISSPNMLDCEATIASESFDANIRKPMTAFFAKAFRRDYQKRFDNAEEMLKAWYQIFLEIEKPGTISSHHPDEFNQAEAIKSATLDTQLLSLGLSAQALSALERMNVNTVQDLLSVPFNEFRCMRGIGINTRNEVVTLTHSLHRTNPDFKADEILPEIVPRTEARQASIDEMFKEISKTGSTDAKAVLHAYLGNARPEVLPIWAGRKAIAGHFEMQDDDVTDILNHARNRWQKLPFITKIRDDINLILAKHGGLMGLRDLVSALLTARGSVLEEPHRTNIAIAVCRAALETEQTVQERRFFDVRINDSILIINDTELTAYAEKLGFVADELADKEPLASPIRVIHTLRNIPAPEGSPPIPTDNGLLKIAVCASTKAALSARMEIYPRNMSALRMIRLSQGMLSGIPKLTVDDIHQRVKGRYPEGEKLPGRPELDELLKQAGLDIRWDASAADRKGAYFYTYSDYTIDPTGSTLSRPTIHGEVSKGIAPEEADARIFDRKLKKAFEEGGFLVISAPLPYMNQAKAALLNRFAVKPINFDELFIPIMQKTAEQHQIKWDVVVKADAAEKTSRDWQNLNRLVEMCIPAAKHSILDNKSTVLLTGIGLLARYDRLNLFDDLRDQISASDIPIEGLWILIPGDGKNALPTIDGKAIPLLGSGQFANMSKQWIRKWMDTRKKDVQTS